MNKTVLAVLLLFSPGCMLCQTPQKNVLTTEIALHYGSILPHHDFMFDFLEGPLVAGEIKIGLQTIGKRPWEQLYGYPRFGLGYTFSTLGNPDVLGYPNGAYSFLDIPIIKSRKISLQNQMCLGLSFNFNRYHPVENPLNLSIGSRINVFFSFDYHLSFRLSEQMSLNQGVRFSHFSNGRIKLPNVGFYMLNYYAGLQFSFLNDSKEEYVHELPPFKARNNIYIWMSGSTKEYEGSLGRNYPATTLCVGLSRQVGRISRIGVGLDMFYDASIMSASEEELSFSEVFRQGFHLGHELIVYRFSLIVQQGIYTYRRVNLHQLYYSRLGLRYHLTPGFYSKVSLKAHWGKADFIEWGFGFNI
jgi:hypothetical protein